MTYTTRRGSADDWATLCDDCGACDESPNLAGIARWQWQHACPHAPREF